MRLRSCTRCFSILALVGVPFPASLAQTDLEDGVDRCLEESFPENRSGFPALLNCLGLDSEAVEVGVQAGVHASGFLDGWRGQRLRLVDTWHPPGDSSSSQNHQMFYVDIANVNDADAGKQHKAQCEARLIDALRSGRAEMINLDSTVAASGTADGQLDFVYLDARHDFAGVAADVHAWWALSLRVEATLFTFGFNATLFGTIALHNLGLDAEALGGDEKLQAETLALHQTTRVTWLDDAVIDAKASHACETLLLEILESNVLGH